MAEPSTAVGPRRRAALERIASQERLDVLTDVTRPSDWIAFWVFATLIATAVLWGVFGSVPVKVQGEGILVRGGEIGEVTSPVQGTLDRVLVHSGDVIAPGQTVATLSQAEIRRDLEQRRREYDQVKPEAEATISGIELRLDGLVRRERNVSELVRKGLKARPELLAIQAEISAAKEQIQGQKNRVRALEREINLLQGRLAENSGIRSSAAGKVIDLSVRAGDTVQVGGQILTLEPIGGKVQATIFLPAGDGKKVREGMASRVAPANVRPEEDGYLLARVASYASFPATPEMLRKVLRNEQMVGRLGEQGPLYKVVLDLEPDPHAHQPDRFLWTSAKSAETTVQTGTVCTGQVIVEHRRPIEYVLTFLRHGARG